jgi:TonB family protein
MLQERIEENWRTFLTEEEGVLGEVRIQIAPDGRVREFVFLKGSGQSHVDASIVNALKKVALAPPPASLADRPLILRFWPSGPRS